MVADSNTQLNNKQKRVCFSDANAYAKTRPVANKKTRDALDIVLAEKLEIEVEELMAKIEEFKSQGCALFI